MFWNLRLRTMAQASSVLSLGKRINKMFDLHPLQEKTPATDAKN